MATTETTRRAFVAAVAAAAATKAATGPAPSSNKLVIFSKHLQWLPWEEVGATAAELGFDGVDLTVRKGGHVSPERAADDLPRAAEAIKKGGSQLVMITSDIIDARTPNAERVLKAASGLGVSHYRWGGFKYDDATPIPDQLHALRPRVKDLAALNRQYNMTAMYHTHSGNEVGAPIWDLYLVLRDFDAKDVAINFDIGHATIEGGLGGWIRSAQLSRPYMRGIALKDFRWAKNARGEWSVEWCPAGEGMVHFPKFLAMLKQANFQGPIQVHYEYAGLGGADHGAVKLDLPAAEVLAKMKRDQQFLRARLKEAGLL
jgi:sugar phosphate isomerase/epimerase